MTARDITMETENILDQITAKARGRVRKKKEFVSPQEIKMRAEAICQDTLKKPKITFREALMKEGMSYICEVKKASPSKGIITDDFPYLDIAMEYEAAGAAAISCLTEPFYFMGDDRYLAEISEAVDIPVLRKDFVVSDYMIYEAKTLGASAVLLICSILTEEKLSEYIRLSQNLGMDALVEAHDEAEVKKAVNAGANIIGINNRDLRSFRVDMENSVKLRSLVPENIIFVSESGIRSNDDIRKLRHNNVDAVLIGEILMRSSDKKAALKELSGGLDAGGKAKTAAER
ncbi:indole-3-glycerol phosphate synthase TrpC [Lentihominibacter sp.]|jgi:indole-3-glycerol phosphate synthase